MEDDKVGESEHEASADAPSVSEDRLYRGLASRERRRLLFALLDEPESSVEKLATLLTRWEVTEAGMMATPAEYEETRTELVHNHLPLLDAAGFVEYDPERGTVRVVPLDPVVNALICQSVETDPPTQS